MEVRLIYPLIYTDIRRRHKYCTHLLSLLEFPFSLGKEMLKANDGKDLVLAIKLSKSKRNTLFNIFINRSANKRSY